MIPSDFALADNDVAEMVVQTPGPRIVGFYAEPRRQPPSRNAPLSFGHQHRRQPTPLESGPRADLDDRSGTRMLGIVDGALAHGLAVPFSHDEVLGVTVGIAPVQVRTNALQVRRRVPRLEPCEVGMYEIVHRHPGTSYAPVTTSSNEVSMGCSDTPYAA